MSPETGNMPEGDLESLALVPLADLVRIGGVADAPAWRALSEDPRFLLQTDRAFTPQDLLLFEADVLPILGAEGVPTLYFDFGAGFTVEDRLPLARTPASPRPYSAIVRFRVSPRRIRFDPCEAAGDFLCPEVRVSVVSEAFAIASKTLPVEIPRPMDWVGAQGADAPAALSGTVRLGAIARLENEDAWPALAEHLRNIGFLDRLYVSVPEGAGPGIEARVADDFPQASVRRVPEGVADATDFLDWLPVAVEHGVDLLGRVRAGQPKEEGEGSAPAELEALLGRESTVRDIVSAFLGDSSVGLMAPAAPTAPAMFWARADALKPLLPAGNVSHGPDEAANGSGTGATELADRVLAAVASQGFRVAPVAAPGLPAGKAIPVAAAPGEQASAESPSMPRDDAGHATEHQDFPALHAPGNLALEPEEGLLELPGKPHGWQSTHNDPQFRLRGLEGLRGKWIRLRIAMVSEENVRWSPVLYLDTGRGYSEKTAIFLPPPDPASGLCELIFHLPDKLRRARFDPLDSVATFFVSDAQADVLDPRAAGTAMVDDIARRGGDAESIQYWREAVARARSSRAVERELQKLHGEYARLSCRHYSYERWIELSEPPRRRHAQLAREQEGWPYRPTITVAMPTYNTPERLLRAAIDSVIAQVYPHWELCIADDASTDARVRPLLESYAASDARIKVVFRDKNGHISAATNSAVAIATGEYVALLDHDDELHPLALHYVAEAIVRNPGCELIYSDEDKIDEGGRRQGPYFKSDYNHDLLLAQNMISHLGVYRTARLREIGGFSEGLDGSQDYDLALRFLEVIPQGAVVHVPRVLYHWRLTAGSTSVSIDNKNYAFIAAAGAIRGHLARTGVEATVMEDSGIGGHTRVAYPLPDPAPLVSVIIPTRDRADLLRHAVEAATAKCGYPRTEVIVVDNGSTEAKSLHYLATLERRGVEIVRDDRPFNFSALNNLGAKSATGSLLLFLNNDIEPLEPGWLSEMVAQCSRRDVGAVGAKLLYPDGTVQHAGVILGLGGLAAHAHHGAPGNSPGYFGRAGLTSEFSAVTGACLLTSRDLFDRLGGFDEELPVAYNDIDYCLRVRGQGLKVIYTPYAKLVHNESASRGSDESGARQQRLERDKARMREKWGARLERDPFYSPNLTLTEHGGFTLRW